ncbi:MAG: hypothetical protein IAG10_27240 [Planctomycetaceae bacterium]|nr:hypothetical protein [Planctomycetaceae bacterium]
MSWEAYLMFALIPGFLAGLLVVIGKLSGWARLAERYAADREPDDGTYFRGQFFRIGWCDYNGCMTIRVAPDGIYLAVWPIFVGHAPLLIPWSAVWLVEEQRERWFAFVLIDVGQPPLARLRLPLRVIDAGRQWLQPAQPTA